MCKNWIILLAILVILLVGCSSVSASPATKIVGGVASNVASAVLKWLWSLKSTTKTAVPSRSMMRFESGYVVETVFDGSKLGIEPHSVVVSAFGELLVLDSENSNIYKISAPLSRYSRPKLFIGSPEGYTGHIDGKLREARMYHPRGLTVDGFGNIYVADTMNMAIRKISDTGVVTIAGGRLSRGGGHVDGPSEDAMFSNDFDLVYVGSSCSILVIDRGNQAIREIQLHEDDCSTQYEGNLHLGIAVLGAAVFFGYMLALLQRRISTMLSYEDVYARDLPPAPYQRPPPKSIRPPLIPLEDNKYEQQDDEGLFTSLGRLIANTGSSFFEIFGGLFSGIRRKPSYHPIQQQQQQQQSKHGNSWPLQESFVIPQEDEPPPIETREPTPRKSYPFVAKDTENNLNQFRQSKSYHDRWNGDYRQQPPYQLQHHQYHQKHKMSSPQTYYEHENYETNEIVFGAVQEQIGRREAMVIKSVDYGEPSSYISQNIRSRYNCMSYSSYGY